MNLEGKLLGNRYEIIEKIGNGGMATVYKARCNVLNRYVAAKILRDEFTTDQEFIRRFEAEAQSAARLTHPNIVSIYDVGVEDNLYYIVMELIQGKTLKEIIVEEQGPLPWKWSINVAIQIASALEMAHKNNIIHRDIKPHNIIITEDGIAKVTDFGIAKAVSNSTITAFGTTIGSVHYFSPEHARGGFTDAKSDLYSLGVVMYEMLTGRVPFDADTPVSVALKHMQEDPIEPIEVNPNVPLAVNKIIMKALKKDTTLRYQTSTEMLRDLRASLKNPNGDFVEDNDYDETARTQKVNLNEYESKKNNKSEEKETKKENKFIAFIKKHNKLSIFIGLILLFFIAFGSTMLILKVTNPPEVKVPNIIGLTKEEAQRELEAAKLKLDENIKEEYDKDVAEGRIISIKTEIGDYTKDATTILPVKEGEKISIIISKGQEKAIVPKVIGMKEDEAIKALEDAKLKYERIEEASKKVEEGYIISQETDPETEVFAGDTVKIHVSTGVEKVTMVSVIDKTEEEAKKALKDIGITNINLAYEEDSSKEKGKVIKQSIESGSTVEKDSTITITVNNYEASKSVALTIDVKSITGGYTESSNKNSNTNATNNTAGTTDSSIAKTVNIVIKSGDNVIWQDSGADKNKTVTSNILGKGTMNLTLNITDSNGGSWTRQFDINFNTETAKTIK